MGTLISLSHYINESLLDDEYVLMDETGREAKSKDTLFKLFKRDKIELYGNFSQQYQKYSDKKELDKTMYKCLDDAGLYPNLKGKYDELRNIIGSQRFYKNENELGNSLHKILSSCFDCKFDVIVNYFAHQKTIMIDISFLKGGQFIMIFDNKGR